LSPVRISSIFCLPDQSREPLRTTEARDDPQVDFGLAQPDPFARDAQMARHGELQPSAETKQTIDRCNDGLVHLFDAVEDPLPTRREFPTLRRVGIPATSLTSARK
jgi:hypothetical protein